MQARAIRSTGRLELFGFNSTHCTPRNTSKFTTLLFSFERELSCYDSSEWE